LSTAVENGPTTILIGGRMTGLTGLTVGALYYASGTAGEITTTAPTYPRLVGQADLTGTALVMAIRTNAVRRVHSVQSTVGNIGAGEDILASYTAPEGELFAQGMAYEIHFFGTTANTANAKTLRIRIIEGANNTVLTAPALTVSEAGFWSLEAKLVRINTTQAKTWARTTTGPTAGAVVTQAVATSITATWANAVEIRITGEATSTDDITIQGGTIQVVPL
jgi:hypothetical protein